jgi:apolipoprotein D and lipocalin family protein
MKKRTLPAMIVAALTAACAGSQPPLETVDYVDLERFMGDWYVIANIPTFVEKGAHNAVETYALNDDGTIATTFVFRKDGFDGEQKEHTPKGFITDTASNAIWGMQFIWPIKADYRIVYLTEDYSQTVIARNKRDYVWVMARTPEIPADDYARMTDKIASMGYDMSKLVKVPQQW